MSRLLVSVLPLMALLKLGASDIVGSGRSSMPLLASCSDLGEVKAVIQASDAIQIHYSMAYASQTCYAVSVRMNGEIVDGFLLGAAHPAIGEFERAARSHVASILPAPRPEPRVAPKPAEPSGPVSFAGFKATDVMGRRVELAAMRAPLIILYFWSASDRRSIKDAQILDYVYEQYHPKGIEIVGVASAPSPARLRQICQQNESLWAQVLDSGEIARRYQVSPERPYFVLDQQRNVIAALKSGAEIDAVLQKQLAR